MLGICQESIDATDVANGRVVKIRILGISRAVADGALAIGAKVRVAADGRVTGLAAATANQNVVGVALTPTTTAGDWVDVLLTPGTQAST